MSLFPLPATHVQHYRHKMSHITNQTLIILSTHITIRRALKQKCLDDSSTPASHVPHVLSLYLFFSDPFSFTIHRREGGRDGDETVGDEDWMKDGL